MRHLAVAALLALAALLFPRAASAAITCTVDNASDLNFGTLTLPVGAVTSTLNVTVSCRGNNNNDVGDSVLVCIGTNDGGNPRQMDRTAAPVRTLDYQIYTDSTYTQPANYTYNASATLTIASRNTPVTRIIPLYGRLAATQPNNPTPGTYNEPISAVWGYSTATNANCANNVAPATPNYSFTSRAVLQGSCLIAAQNLDFGTHTSLATARDAQANLTVTCTNGTAYTVKLNAGLNGTLPNRRMALNGTGPQTINYNLYTTAARNTIWGDGASGTSTVIGAGTGAGQGTPTAHTVYGRVPATPTFTAGSYTDTVTATVEY
ncbi:Csu type fimbrial protein [Lysobacter panacisoli]|uniref:Spore coat U domain-containing protein n=1 Tax=Lysobacter panacisoli TaxID=1255263 RepID=A0ABP9L0M8_9GAMM|nr:spore coat U domain-containing protein [Lysobacter panacisoli]